MDAAAIPEDQGSHYGVKVGESDRLTGQFQRLSRRHDIEMHLADRLGAGCDYPGMFASIAALSDLPLWLLDAHGQRVLSPSSSFDRLDTTMMRDELREHSSDRVHHMVLGTQSGVVRRCLVKAILDASDTKSTGWLVMGEVGTRRLGVHDQYLLERGSVYLTRHQSLHRAMHRSATEFSRVVVEQLLQRPHDANKLPDYVRQVGLALDSRCVVVALDDSAAERVQDLESLISSVENAIGGRVLGARTVRGLALIVDASLADRMDDSRFIEDVCRALTVALPDVGIQCGVSSSVTVDGLADGYEEALEIIACLERFSADHTRILSVRDLGPARILVANGNIAAIRRYVEHTFGPLWTDGADADMQTLMSTLAHFSRAGHNVRRTAAQMLLHENTIRQRLARVQKLIGLDMLTDPFAQLSVHTALSIIALRNRAHPLWDPRARGSEGLSRLRPQR